MSAWLDVRTNAWRYRFKYKGLRYSGTPTERNTKAAAKKAEQEHRFRLEHPELMAPDRGKEATPTVREFETEFMDVYACNNNKPSEVRSKRSIFVHHVRPLLGEYHLDMVTRREVETFKAALRKKGLSRKRINNVLTVVGKLLSYAEEIGLIQKAPGMNLLKVEKQQFKFLDLDELDALVLAAEKEPMWLVAILLGADAGLRLGEIRALQWSDWNRTTKQITVSRAFAKNDLGATKGWNLRTIPTTKRLDRALRRWRHLRGEFIICNLDGSWRRETQMRSQLPRLGRAAALEQEVTWHPLRHTFCSHLAMKGAPAKTIQELAGHSELSTTLKYMHLAGGAKEQAIALLDA